MWVATDCAIHATPENFENAAFISPVHTYPEETLFKPEQFKTVGFVGRNILKTEVFEKYDVLINHVINSNPKFLRCSADGKTFEVFFPSENFVFKFFGATGTESSVKDASNNAQLPPKSHGPISRLRSNRFHGFLIPSVRQPHWI